MSDEKICPACNQPYDDYGGTIEINGREVCQRCGNRILGMPEDTQWFETEEEKSESGTEVKDDSEETDYDEDDYDDDEEEELTEEDHEPIVTKIMEREPMTVSEDNVLVVREEPEVPHHTVVVPVVKEEESKETPKEDAKEPEEPQKEDADSDAEQDSDDEDEPEPKRKWFAFRKIERRREPKKKKEPQKEREYDPDSFHERFRRWKLIHNEGYVILKTFSRDAREEYHLESTLIKMEDLPRDAVQVTNEKHTYCLDLVKSSKWYLETHTDPYEEFYESQFTASDAALYMMSNKIDNALAIRWTELSHVDYKKYMIIAGAVLFVILFMIMRVSG